MPYVRSLTDVLSGYLDWHLSRLKLMARFTSSVLTLTTTDLSKVALALKARPKQESNYRRIQRFLSGYEVDFRALGGLLLHLLLLHLLPQRPPYEVVIDRTEWHFGETAVNLLMVGIAHKGMGMCARVFGPVDRLISAKTQQRSEVLIREYRESARDVLGVGCTRSRSAVAPGCST